MATKNRCLVIIFCLSSLAYFVTDIFFTDAFLYLIGGLLSSVLSLVGLKKGVFLFWLILLLGTIAYYRIVKGRFLKWLLFILIWVLLYLLDVEMYKIMPDISSRQGMVMHIVLAVLLKSALLTWVYYNFADRKSVED